MASRKSGILALAPALLLSLGLATALGCTGKNRYSVPAVTGFNPTSAPVGATVVIYGGAFKGILYVSFGGQQTTFQVSSPGVIVAVVPEAATTGPIVVENPAGLGDSYQSFVVQPAITDIAPTSGPAGTPITVTGSGFYGITAATINGAAVPFTYNSPNQVTLVAGSESGPVVVTSSGLQTQEPGPTFTVGP